MKRTSVLVMHGRGDNGCGMPAYAVEREPKSQDELMDLIQPPGTAQGELMRCGSCGRRFVPTWPPMIAIGVDLTEGCDGEADS